MTLSPPLALLAELTYRCPLRCGYCSNPTDWGRFSPELDTETWQRVVREAAQMGVLQLHLSGGEPLLRQDLETIVRTARDEGLYTNLITSAWGLSEARAEALAAAGVDHVQVSLQDAHEGPANAVAGVAMHAAKLKAAEGVRARGMGLSVNVVLHRQNLDRIAEIIALAESIGAERLELANTQFHGSALVNRASLLGSREQLEHAAAVASREKARLRGVMDVLYVLPDYYTDVPKPCLDGWGRRFLTVIPDGTVLPCQGATSLPGMVFDNVRTTDLHHVWTSGADFARFRGTSWMKAPCASCDRREVDHGGCRCQAFALTGDAAAADPTCAKSPHHTVIEKARAERSEAPALFRIDTSRMRKG